MWPAVLALLLGLVAGPASAGCVHGACVDWEDRGNGEIGFLASHAFPVPLQVKLELELEGWVAEPGDEVVVRVPTGERIEVARIRHGGGTDAKWRYRWRTALGEPGAVHDEGARYRIPFGGAAPRRLTQAGNGGFSHRGRTAYDFRMPVGTPILAARAGVVAKVVDEYTRGGRRKSLGGKANRVAVVHDDGSVAMYVHLAKGAAVAIGDRVIAGQRLGPSGNTGFTTDPHLHFEVYTAVPGQTETESVPIRFDDGSPRGTVPVAGSYYGPSEEVPPAPAGSAPASPAEESQP